MMSDSESITTSPSDRSDGDTAQLNAALNHAARGWQVFPLCRPAPDGACVNHEQCNHPGKVPLIREWTTRATTNDLTIRQWWAGWPDANVGILTGEASDLLVLDIDQRHGGAESLEQLEATYGPLPKTQAVRTGDGIHLYFRYFDCGLKNGMHLARGVEVRTNNGSVVAHESGALALNLFRQVRPEFAPTIPQDWPEHVRVYRGACARDWPAACERVRGGFAWTINREVALTFARRLFPSPNRPVDLVGFVPVGCLGSTVVPRQDVIAYFMAEPLEPVVLGGRTFEVEDDDYHEDECIIEPQSIDGIEYERVEDPYKEERVATA